MPSHFSEHDREWLESILERFSRDRQAKVCLKYSEAYIAAYDACEVEHKKENRARHEANSRLLKYSRNIEEVLKMKVHEPKGALPDEGL